VEEVRIPKFGMSTVDVDVTQIYIAVGQAIAVGDPIVDVDTDKVTSTIESEVAGVVVEVAVELDATYQVGDLVCRVQV
jgi:pyruvate/2-oxoglutarate dehydrogenase complex dihydrolipoamide acyltransferase (E2) component